jgi:hypothetical protein
MEVVRSALAPANNIGPFKKLAIHQQSRLEPNKMAKERLGSADFDSIYRQNL